MVDTNAPVVDGKLFSDGDREAVTIVNRSATGPFLFTCDHACNHIPVRLGDMGMTPEQLQSHIAWDPGALQVGLELSSLFGSPLVYGGYSRLVVDLNRPPTSPGSMPVESAGTPIPGNQALGAFERRLRLDALFHPYHDAIEGLLTERQRSNLATNLVAIHSFTPDYPGETRPWHVGVIHRHDHGLGVALIEALREDEDVVVGDNLPFQIHDDGDATIPRHGEQRHLPNVLVELRQDTLATAADRDIWAKRLHRALQRAITISE